MIGVDENGSITPDSELYTDAASVEDVLKADASNPPRIRIMCGWQLTALSSSLHSKKTIWPLRITEPLMRKILTAYRVDPAFLHVLFSSGQSPNLAESGSRNFARNRTTDGSEAYVDNWRWYFRYLGDSFVKKNDRIMTLDLDEPSSVRLNFNEVQELRELGDTTLSLKDHCQCAQSILERLQAIPEAKFENKWSLQQYSDRLSDDVTSIVTLTNRINNSIDLAAYFLELKNQDTAAKMNKTMSELTSKTNKDTTSMKWITILTLVYLPANFVCTLYGMNLFAFNEENRQLAIAKDFWIYVVTWLPFTFLTILGYSWLKRSDEPEENGLSSQLEALQLKFTTRIRRRKPGTSDQDLELSSSTLRQADAFRV
ncbi:MAG: hypothetical protein Q9163_001703 [Psora crenata]